MVVVFQLKSQFNLYKKLNRYRKNGDKSPFQSLEDYPVVEKWLTENEGRKFLNSQKGKEWLTEYQSLKRASSEALDEPLKRVVDKANEVFDLQKAQRVRASNNVQDPPGIFRSRNDFTYQESTIPLSALGPNVDRLRETCGRTLTRLADKKTKLATDSKYFRFWTRTENLEPSLAHGIITLAGVGGTLWLHWLYTTPKIQSSETPKSHKDSAPDKSLRLSAGAK